MSDLLKKTREICQMFEIKPERSKGQNFLINEKIYDEIIKAAELKVDDLVLEVGPGLGFLTTKLAARAKKVIAVELDDTLAVYLTTGFAAQDADNVEIINADILRFNPEKLAGQKYKIVANLPYNISSIFLRQFLSSEHRPEMMVLMLQKEVAERIVAQAPEMSVLAVSVQYYAEVEIIREVKAGNFWPEPQVDSAIIRIRVRPERHQAETDKQFFRLVKIGFSAKRKMLKNNLSAGLKISPPEAEKVLLASGFDAKVRAEDLSPADWQKLFGSFRSFMV